MEDYEREALDHCLVESCAAFEPSDVTDHLLGIGILNPEEVLKILGEIVPWARGQQFVTVLKRKAGNAFDVFLRALKLSSKYGELVIDLEMSVVRLQNYNGKILELVQGSSHEENFMYLNMLFSVADSLDLTDSLKLCKHFRIDDQWSDAVTRSQNPGVTTITICRRMRIVTFSNIQTLRSALRFLSLDKQAGIVEQYIVALEYQELEVIMKNADPELMPDKVKEILQDRTTWFKVGKKLNHELSTGANYGKTLLADIKVESGLLILKIPTVTSLKCLYRELTSEKLTSKFLSILVKTGYNQGVFTTDKREIAITLTTNEHTYQILEIHFENLAARNGDDLWESPHDEPTNPTLPSALGPEISLTITRTYPDTLLRQLRGIINDKQTLHTKGRSLRTFFYEHFEDVLCSRIRNERTGVCFVLRVSTASAFHQLHRALSNGELAKDMRELVQNTVGDKLTKNGRIYIKTNDEEYCAAKSYFETNTVSSRLRHLRRECSRPITIKSGKLAGPLYVDPESLEMIEQMRRERQDYENAHSGPKTV